MPFFASLLDFSFLFAEVQMLWREPMLTFRPWKLNSKLPAKLGMSPLLPKPLLRRLLN
jgi:hypothetical protein